ncbi:MAG: RsmD family RNA methyltransferase, partial [Gemmatimonadetes bacterium]|nr:RsmD family RNA methyltransferase [Gemmatimonadota bacterium]
MVRVIAGKFKHQRLATLRGPETRPTSDKLKETLFNLVREEVEKSVFLDCFSGSGSVGIEALSRGARDVTLIECAPRAVQVIERNLKSLAPPPPAHDKLLTHPVHVS